MSSQVFICFANTDGRQRAYALHAALHQRGIDAFLAEEDAVGRRWDEAIREALASARAAAVVVTEGLVDSVYVRSELTTALTFADRGQMVVIPWTTEASPPREAWPLGLSAWGPLQREDAAQAADAILRLVSPPPIGAPDSAGAERALDEARAHLQARRFSEAVGALDAVLAAVDSSEPAGRALRSRALLNKIAALNALQRHEEIDGLLAQVRPDGLDAGALGTWGRFLVGAWQWDRALQVAPHSAVVRQLVALRRDQQLPEDPLADDPDVQLSAAALLTEQGRCASALELLLPLLEGNLLDSGRELACTWIAHALYRAWVGLSAEVVSDAGTPLQALRDRAEAWPEVETLRRILELDPPALELVDEDVPVPPWVDVLEENPDLSRVEQLARTHPTVGPVLLRLSQLRVEHGAAAAAVEPARRAFELLPGNGQRAWLCLALWHAGQAEAARATAAGLVPLDDLTWEASVRTAADTPTSFARAREWASAMDSQPAWATVVQLGGRLGEVAIARHAAHRLLEGDALPVRTLRAIAVAALAPGAVTDETLARAVAARLRTDHTGDADAEALRLTLMVALSDDQPLDWELLADSGHVAILDLDEARRHLGRLATRGDALDALFAAGAVCFETWAGQRGLLPGAAALGVQRGELAVPPPVPPHEDVEPWEGRPCLIGALGVEILVAAELHEPFGRSAARVAMLEDTWTRFMGGPASALAPAWRRERARVTRQWAVVGALPTVEAAPNLTRVDIDGARSWLASLGYLERRGPEEVWEPPPEVVLGELAILGLDQHLEPFLRACADHGRQVVVSGRAHAQSASRIRELEHRLDAHELAATAHRWIAALDAEGRLDVLRVPEPPPLPPLRSEPSAAVERTWAAREALRAHFDLHLITAEFTELGQHGHPPLHVMARRQWDAGSLKALGDRYAGLSRRATTIGSVVRTLSEPSPSRSAQRGQLAAAGYVDALDGADLVELFEAFGDLDGAEPRRRLDGLVRWAGRDHLPHHGLLGQHIGLTLVSTAFEVLWLRDAPHPQASRATRSLLDLIEHLDRRTAWRLALGKHAIYGVAGQCLGRPGAFVEAATAAQTDQIAIGAQSRAGALWAEIGAWSSSSAARSGAIQQALAAAMRRTRALAPDAELRPTLFAIMLGQLPLGHRPLIDLSGPAWAERLRSGELDPARETLQLEGETWSLGELIDAVHGASLSRDGLSLQAAQVQLEGRSRPLEIRFPLELALVRHTPLAADVAQATAEGLWGEDRRAADAATAWLEQRNPDTERVLLDALARSPVREIRSFPPALLSWSPWTHRAFTSVRSISELCEVLGEPTEGNAEAAREELRSQMHDREGSVDLRPLLAQLGRIPGEWAGAGARVQVGSDEGLHALLREHSRLLEHHRSYAAGTVTDVIVGLAMVAVDAPVQEIEGRVFDLPRMAAELAAAALRPRPEGDAPLPEAFADLEPALVRLCGAVVWGLSVQEPVERWTWLSWRLFAWLAEQLRPGRTDLEMLRRLAEAAPSPDPPDAQILSPDLYDPRRIGEGRVDIRELMVIQALWRVQQLERVDGQPHARIEWRHVVDDLLAVADRAYTPDERLLRTRWGATPLGGRVLCAPDLARLVLLAIDMEHLLRLPLRSRRRWLEDAGTPGEMPADLAAMRDSVLLAFAFLQGRLTDEERRLLHALALDPGFGFRSFARQLVVLQAAAGDSARARAALAAGLPGENGALLAAFWLEAAAEAGALDAGVATVRAVAGELGLDEAPMLLGLARLVLGPQADEAIRVAEALALEPHLAEPLGELLEYARKAESEA